MKPLYERATIVIPTYNRMSMLDRTLASLASSTTSKRDFQVIIADDGSTDETKDVADHYRSLLNVDYAFQENHGFRAAKARNMALYLAKNPLMIFVDCGMLLTTGFIDAHMQAHRKTFRPAAIIGYAWGFDRNNENASYLDCFKNADADDIINRLQIDGRGGDPRDEIYQPVNGNLMTLPCPWTLMWGCNFSVEADVFRIVGGFNENFKTWGAEDSELAYRLYRCGLEFKVARDAAAVHLPHEKEEAVLQKSSLENLARETRQYSDPGIERVLRLGDFGANRL